MNAETEQPKTEPPKKTVMTVPPGGLEFRSEAGELLAALTPLKDGGAALSLAGRQDGPPAVFLWGTDTLAGMTFGAGGAGLVRLNATEKGGSISVDGPAGEFGVNVAAGEEGGMFTLWGPGGNGGVCLGADEEGYGRVSVSGADGVPQIGLLTKPGGALVRLLTSSGGQAVDVGAIGEGGGLVVHDESGAKAFAVPVWKFTTGDAAKTEGQKPN